MSREFVPRVTNGMAYAGADIDKRLSAFKAADIFKAMAAHPDFQRQLRAWAAEEMRGLVAGEYKPEGRSGHDYANAASKNACRTETLANITAWEKANEGQ